MAAANSDASARESRDPLNDEVQEEKLWLKVIPDITTSSQPPSHVGQHRSSAPFRRRI
ncbi:protein of unknown function [Candidatus Filomicrobium marinum]|uniref:Uncharacterized protein n=1 Tax=Candidatus Filomicrobium marinum TaxID=1608628 RepID=A0A0D6JCW9_9HYPH|nr:protein of unknown function [Candidatus Filomicrobium marinum]CPR17490.1 protein of unknown function [Candidatus Filomicrobium marinum]